VAGDLGIDAEMAGSSVAGRLADAAGGAVTGKLSIELSPEFLSELVAPGLVASRSANWSRRSDSIRPFEVSSSYPE
jgi:hypothetical protein